MGRGNILINYIYIYIYIYKKKKKKKKEKECGKWVSGQWGRGDYEGMCVQQTRGGGVS